MTSARRIAYLTDVEGRFDKIEAFCRDNPAVRLTAGGELAVADDAIFVFGGDAIDRGPSGRRVCATLLAAKKAQPDRVVLLAGNRDINKLRLVRELCGHPPSWAPPEVASGPRGALLAFIFSRTMGAKDALAHRARELAASGLPFTDDDVAESFLEDLEPHGALTEYLAHCQLAFRFEETLFVHGAVTRENLHRVPDSDEPAPSVDAWADRLNELYARSMDGFRARRYDAAGRPSWSTIVAYQAPLRGSRLNQASVVYGRPLDARGELALPAPDVVRALRREGIRRVMIGHTPAGDCPALLTDREGFELVLADNSYGRIEGGPLVLASVSGLEVRGETELDSGERAPVRFETTAADHGPLGKRDVATGRILKARLERGDYLAYRPLADYQVEQQAIEPARALSLELEVATS